MTTEEITGIVGNIFGVTEDDIRQKSRKDRGDRVIFARFAAITLCRRKTTLSLSQTARRFNLSNHATVINAMQKCENMIETNRVFSHLFNLTESIINRSDFERMQLADNIPFIYSLETPSDEQVN